MTTPRNDGFPELLPCPFCSDGGSPSLKSFSCGTCECLVVICDTCGAQSGELLVTNSPPDREFAIAAWNRRASPQPLLSREHEPVSNASVTVGGVRVPDGVTIRPFNKEELTVMVPSGNAVTVSGKGRLECRVLFELASLLRLNPAAEVGEVETDEVNFVCSALGNLFAGDKVSSEEEQIINRARLLLRRLAGSRWLPIESVVCDDSDVLMFFQGPLGRFRAEVVNADHDSDSAYWKAHHATHWMRLPSAPEATP